jgi:hypothetical protein
MLRFYLVLPVLILERNSYGEQMGVKDAFKLGFEYTEGNVLSILGLSILVGITIFLPLNIVDFFIKSHVITNFWNPQWSNWFEISLKITIWETVVGIFGVFTAILPSIYYYAIVRKKKM